MPPKIPKKPKAPQPRTPGSIVQRGPDTFLIRVYIGKDEGTGKRQYHSETVRGTRRDAEKAKTRILREKDTGAYIAPAKDTLEAFAASWLETKTDVTPKTRRGYRMRLELDVFPMLGARKLDRITPQDVQAVIADMQRRGLSPRTVQLTHVALQMCLELAARWGMIGKNPARGATLPKNKRREMQVLTASQTQALLKATEGTRFHALWALLLTTGMRPSEALALRWADFDGEGVSIQRSLEMDPEQGWRWVESDTKTEASRRRVPLFSMAADALRAHRVRQNEEILKRKLRNPLGLIFPTRAGSFVDVDYARRRFRAALEAAGLPPVRMYDSRHSHATQMLSAGMHPKIMQERLGHANIQVTMNTYTHVLPEMHKEAAEHAARKLGFGS